MTRTTILVALACTLAAARPAHADFDEYAAKAEVAARIAADVSFATVNRVRRTIAFGPQAGLYAGSTFGRGSETVSGVSWGMALYLFKVPSILDFQKLIQDEAERAVKAEVARIIAEGGTPDVKAIARAAYENLKDSIMGPIRPRTLERPRLGVIIEGIAQFQPSSALGARVTATYGIGPISLGLSGSFTRGDSNTIAYVGPETSLRLTPWGKSWTPVIDIYVRFDVGFDDGDRPYLLTLGGRMLLDLI